ncbi:MarR family winged helix-turn-helix transcriptional regulator [Streptococcus cuniculi]|uniref:MarR family transcriptional regulator n=1 Tax=Streptococcus cuniculi TaxID=1432788 RepID=A0A4Y9JEE0_9STRE|nr:MarR family transcriptional regulator [Streptococcus cuniculi]MBF0777680.1 MarR family transcriptional regulator [Streptococcus cuniculi]TFU98319.1 MarR family transcriptional regulator [Streptococcus cuniculi]
MFNQWLIFHAKHETIKNKLELLLMKYQLTLSSYTVLYLLSLQELNELRIVELSKKLGLSKSATSRLVVKMEKQTNYLVRETCEKDDRGLYAVLTTEGSELISTIQKDVESLLKQCI